MPRRPSVRYYESRQGYYAKIHGVQHRLATGPDDFPHGDTYQAALKAFGELVTGGGKKAEVTSKKTLSEVSQAYLDWLQPRRKDGTLQVRKRALDAFCGRLGERPAEELTHLEVTAVCDLMRIPRQKRHRLCSWSNGNIRSALISIHACLNWASKKANKLIKENPLQGIEMPKPRSRGKDCIVTPEAHELILKHASPWLRDVIMVLKYSGARPGEVINAEAHNYNAKLGALVYAKDSQEGGYSHKNSDTTDNDRVIVLVGEAHEIVKRLVAQYPSGPIFRTRAVKRKGPLAGQRWKYDSLHLMDAFRRLRKYIGLPKFTPMSYRHTFATEWILAGKSIDLLASLLGNSPKMIRRHYAHIIGQPQLRAAMEDFLAGH